MIFDWREMSWRADDDDVIAVNVRDADTLLADVEERILAKQGFSVATLNLDHLVKMRRDPDFAEAYASMSHVTADGNPIVWLLRLAGVHVSLVPGSELVKPAVAVAEKCNVPIGLLGSTSASLAKAASVLKAEFPHLEVVSQIAPSMSFDPQGKEAEAAITQLAESGARVVFLALGAPNQERLAQRISELQPQMGTFSIGAGLDFLSGSQIRAPSWARRFALEWLWRLLRSPRRLGTRYLKCFAILPGLAFATLRSRLQSHDQSTERKI